MAAYAHTVTSGMRKPEKIAPGLGVYHGSVDITNYNTTLAEVVGITGKFRSAPVVICEGVSDAGYLIQWDPVGKSFKAYYSTTAHQHTETGATTAANTAAAGSEVANDVDVGAISFVAFGFI